MLQLEQILGMIRNGYNPEQLVLSMMESRMKGTPMGDNLLNLARQGNTAEIEKIARNLAAQQGIDYDKEFNEFKKLIGLK
jgi:hypothetical protein